MGISGYEVLVMTTISPLILGISPLRNVILRGTRLYHILALSAIASYLILHPVYRLLTVGFGVSMSCLAWTSTLYLERHQPHKVESRIMAFSLGLLLSSIAKFAFWTNNPLWPIMHAPNGGWNATGLILGLLAAIRSTRTIGSGRGGDGLSPPAKGSGTLAACGLAGLLFSM